MATRTEIENLAVIHLGSSIDIGSFTNSDSDEAKSLRLLFGFAVDIMFREFRWDWATKTEFLELLGESIHPQYAFAYRYPGDCFFFKKILSDVRNDNLQSRVKFRRGRATHEQNTIAMIFTDRPEACGEWIVNDLEEIDYPGDFAMALSWQLAYYLAPSTTGGDPFKLQQAALNNWTFHLSIAMRNAAEEGQIDEMPDDEILRARRTIIEAGRRPPNNTFFPSGTVISS